MEEEDVSEMVVSWVWKESDCALVLTRVMLLYQLFGFGIARVPEKQRQQWSSFICKNTLPLAQPYESCFT